MVVKNPLIRPAISWGVNVALGGVPLNYHDSRLHEKRSKASIHGGGFWGNRVLRFRGGFFFLPHISIPWTLL